MNVTLNPRQERFIEEKLKAGQYASVSDLINDALETLMGQEQLSSTDIEELRSEVMAGLEQHQRGESTPLDMQAIKAQVHARTSED
ncbi:MAG TPA: type II toxin-antitoxin system ParD family antitoxin [Tepidisphaeraceae bacterium]|jgi:putative addiction module CopG family antidote|nr:type II toxin-antitoxin system ParD family antitoxin [Tepidisphaeraceae bacterium]